MAAEEILAAWEVKQGGSELGALVAAAQDGRLGNPEVRFRLVASRGDSITVQRVDGCAPLAGTLLYVSKRGPYEVARCERWPGGRELLLLEAWPRR